MKKRVLITGASGFVGYHLIEKALNNNLAVYAAVRKSSQVDHLKNLNINFTYPDFDDISSLKNDIEQNQYDYIIHAAGITKARTQDEYNHINAGYTANLAEAAVASGQIKNFVLISSLAAIGPLELMEGIINEHTNPKPITAYGVSKLLAEKKLQAFNNLNYCILRPTGVYGPREKDIFIVLKQIAKGIEPYIGRVPQKLSFIYVKDLADVAINALQATNQKTYNICDGNFYDRYELANLTKQILGVKTAKFHLPLNFVKIIAAVAEKVSSLSGKASALNIEKLKELTAVNWHCSIEAAKTELSFHPKYNLQSGLKESYDWYKANKWL